MYVCMYLCMHVCMYVYMYVCIYACIYVSMYVCMQGWIYVWIDGSMHACMYMYVCMYVYTCMDVYLYIYNMCRDVCMYLAYINQFQNTHNLIYVYLTSTRCTQKYKISLIIGAFVKNYVISRCIHIMQN